MGVASQTVTPISSATAGETPKTGSKETVYSLFCFFFPKNLRFSNCCSISFCIICESLIFALIIQLRVQISDSGTAWQVTSIKRCMTCKVLLVTADVTSVWRQLCHSAVCPWPMKMWNQHSKNQHIISFPKINYEQNVHVTFNFI